VGTAAQHNRSAIKTCEFGKSQTCLYSKQQ